MAAAELSALNNVRPVEVVAEAPASELTPPSREEKKALDELTNIVKTELAGELTRLTKLFQKWDIDHSGAIDRDEFRRGVKALSQSATDEICDVIFRECDVDGSGSIDSSEFVRYAVRDSLFRQKGRMQALFKLWDVDSSGTLNKEEWRFAVEHIGFVAPQDDVDALFEIMDEDRSGTRAQCTPATATHEPCTRRAREPRATSLQPRA